MNVPRQAAAAPYVSAGDNARVLSNPKPPPGVPDLRRDAAHAAPHTADRDSFAVTALADLTDRSLHATAAHFTSGLSPAALAQAYLDWATHLASAPGKLMQVLRVTAETRIGLGINRLLPRRDGRRAAGC
jgi:polyhydroxyalkanoate synthase subunit PhaC